MNSKPQGTGVAIVTPFTKDNLIDLTSLSALIQRLSESEVDFLVPLGTTAETPTLEAAEKEAILDKVFEIAPSEMPVWVGCGGNNTVAVARQMQLWAERYPLSGFLSVSPYYNRPTQEGLYQHFRHLADSCPKSILLYNVPARTGRSMLPETVIRLAQDCPNIVGVKEASADLSPGMDILAQAPPGFVVLSGDDKLALASLSVGYSGCISVLANIWPRSFASMLRFALAGDFKNARQLHGRLFPFYDLIFEEGNPAGAKAALAELGLCMDRVRLPLAPASSELQAKLRDAIRAFGSE